MSYASMLYIPAHPIPIKAILEKGLGLSPLEGITTPFPTRTTDCVRTTYSHPWPGELCGMEHPIDINCPDDPGDKIGY